MTDANLVLGYVSGEGLARGGIALDADAARRAVEREVGELLKLSAIDAAYAIHAVADQQMARALRAVTTERGREIARYALIAFGGSGPLHAATLADSVGIATVIVPPLAGYFSAIGLAYAPEQLSLVQPIRMPLWEQGTLETVNRELVTMETRLGRGRNGATATIRRMMDLRYRGQAYELTVNLPHPFDAASVEAIATEFESLHHRMYGHAPSAVIEVIRVKMTLERPPPKVELLHDLGARFETAVQRRAHFGTEATNVTVRSRTALREGASGPLLVDDPDTTVVVPPGWRARADAKLNVILEKS